jgi:NSS family neurotransmitter:Na+ symporter
MHEIGTAFFQEELHWPRQRATWILTVVCATIAVFCSLSVGANTNIQVLGLSLMDFCDYLTAQYMLPTGAFLTSIMIGWCVDRRLVREEFFAGGSSRESFFRAWLFSVRFIVPVCLVLIFLHQFGIL